MAAQSRSSQCDGSVDWWPCPTLDAPPLCAALIDPDRGGHFVLRPVGAYEIDRRYLYRTNVLESTYRTAQGVVTVTQALNVGSSGRLPWVEFAHRIVALSGQVTMHWEWRPGDRFGRAAPWITSYHGTPLSIVGDQVVGVIADDATECIDDDDGGAMRGTFTVEPGNHRTIALVASDREPLFIPDLAAVEARLDRTIQYWCRWSHGLNHAGPWASVVERSAWPSSFFWPKTPAPSLLPPPRRFRSASAVKRTGTIDLPGSATPRSHSTHSSTWDSTRKFSTRSPGSSMPLDEMALGLNVFYTLGGEVRHRARGARCAGLCAQPTGTGRQPCRRANSARDLRRSFRHDLALLRTRSRT